MKLENIGLPGLGPSPYIDSKKFAVRYLKACIDNPEQMQQLETLETKGLDGKDIVILSRDKYSHFDKFYIVVNYLEKKTETKEEE